MLKILKSLMVVVAVAAIATGATKAYFTSEVTQPGMTFSSGTLTMTDASQSWMLPVNFSGLKPGDTIRKYVVLHNAGSLDIGHLTVQAQNVSDAGGLLGQIQASVIGWVGGADAAYYTPGWGAGGQTIDSWLTASPEDILSAGAVQYSGGTPPTVVTSGGADDTIIIDFTVPSTMDNTHQNQTASFDLTFHAEQVH